MGLLAFVFHPLNHRFMPSFLKTTCRWVGGLLLAFLVASNAWIWTAGWGRLAASFDEVPEGSVLVLLGTDQFVTGTTEPSGTYQPRIDAAARLARSGRIRLVVTSGTPLHAVAMASQLRAAGVTCPIVEDPYGLRTLDSVQRAQAAYPRAHVVFVSQGWHCVRALWQADRTGLSASAYPSEFGHGWRAVSSALRDCLAKPKAVLDWIGGSRLTTDMPAQLGNRPHA